MKSPSFKECMDVLQVISIVLGIFFVGYQIMNQSATLLDTKKINSANFVLKINDEIHSNKYAKLKSAIDGNKSDSKILHNGFDDRLLDDYINNFETLGMLMQENIITGKMAYIELSYDIEKAWCNNDVKNLIGKLRKVDNNPSGPNAFYSGFEQLATQCLSRDKITCPDLDNK